MINEKAGIRLFKFKKPILNTFLNIPKHNEDKFQH